MRLKRVEIQGYKSFATKTVFDFEGGVTAIVGPNGSGKSNVMDALRWVMGETATSQMRAKKLEDVIFSGSESRAPAGLAEVRVLLDNSENWLPLEFAEVSVTRRVHRSGDSEFLINENRVRLREIQELFTSSGLGQESYALLGQGLVEEVLRLKPEERRALIEEVADVRRHRVKLGEARRKRGQAHENLERARLLVEEIEPQLRRLERQAKRALQHAELSQELHDALGQFYRRERGRLHNELSTRRAVHDRKSAEQTAATLSLEQISKALADWEAALAAARTTLEQSNAAERERLSHVRELEHELAMTQQREGLLRQRGQDLNTDLQRLDAQLEPIKTKESAAEPSLETAEVEGRPADAMGESTIEMELADARSASEQAEAVLREAESRLVMLEREGRETDQQLATLNEADSEDAQRALRLADEGEQLEVLLRERRVELAARRDALQRAEQASADAATAAGDAGSEANLAQTTRKDLSQRFYTTGAYLRGLEASRAERDRRLQRARDRLAMLRELQAESEGTQQGLRALFGSGGVPHEGETTGIPGVVGVVRHLLRAPDGLEHAIEAALEGYLDAVVYTSIDEALQTVRVLLGERAGRIVVLPVDTLKPRPPLAMPSEKGVIGVASELVRCAPENREWVDTLLGRTLVVEGTDTARALIARGLGNAVTRDGSLFRANGTLSGGRVAEQGSFARESELQSLPSQIEELERSLAQTADVEGKREELESLEQALRAAESQSESAVVRRAAAQEEIQANRSISEGLARADAERESAANSAMRAALRKREAEGGHEALRTARLEREAAEMQARTQRGERVGQLREVETDLLALTAESERITRALIPAREALDAVTGDERPEALAVSRLQALERERRNAVQHSQRELIASERELVTAEAAVNESERDSTYLEEQMKADGFDFALGETGTHLHGSATGAEADAATSDSETDSSLSHRAPGESSRARSDGEGSVQHQGGDEADDNQPNLEESLPELRERIEALRGRLRWLGNVNPDATGEYQQIEERYAFLTGEILDLEGAEQRMLQAEAELGEMIDGAFSEAFESVDHHFRRYFQTLFRGGTGRLNLTEAGVGEPGVEIFAQPPGKRVGNLQMLSGGERSLVAMALLFAMLEVNPAPFSVLDEVDAALDEANVARFVDGLQELARRSQFVVITHNRRTIEQADNIYGITMGEDSVSRVLSVRLSDLDLED